MNLPTLLILLVVLALFVLCIRRIRKKGSTCGCGEGACSSCPGCSAAAKPSSGSGA